MHHITSESCEILSINSNNDLSTISKKIQQNNFQKIKKLKIEKKNHIAKNKKSKKCNFFTIINDSCTTKMTNSNPCLRKIFDEDFLKTTQFKKKIIDSVFFINKLIENIKSHIQLMHMFDGFDSDFDKFHFTNDLTNAIKLKIQKCKENIKLEQKTSAFFKIQLRSKRFLSDGFCFFCTKNTCFDSVFNSQFDYKKNIDNLFIPRHYSPVQLCLFSLFREIEKVAETSKFESLYSFFRHFHNLRETLCEIMEDTKLYTLYLNLNGKSEMIKNVFHDFKSKNLELKIILIPEFYSLLFLIVNSQRYLRCCQKNFVFYTFYFYLRLLEFFIEFVSKNENYYVTDIFSNTKKLDERKQIYISLFIRMNFIEPLILIITTNSQILNKYQFHTLSLFEIEQKCQRKQEFDQKMYIFLKIHIWWICHYNKHLISDGFLDCYEDRDLNRFTENNFYQFTIFAQLMNELKNLKSDILSDSLIEKETMMHLRKFQLYCYKQKLFQHK